MTPIERMVYDDILLSIGGMVITDDLLDVVRDRLQEASGQTVEVWAPYDNPGYIKSMFYDGSQYRLATLLPKKIRYYCCLVFELTVVWDGPCENSLDLFARSKQAVEDNQ